MFLPSKEFKKFRDEVTKRILDVEDKVAENNLRSLVGDALVAAMENKDDAVFLSCIGSNQWGNSFKQYFTKNKFNHFLEQAVREVIGEQATKTVAEYVAGEEFIDKIIDRINKKQLG